MEHLMYGDPFTFWAIGYFLFVALTWVGFCEERGIPLHKLPFPQMIGALLWPLIVIGSLILFVVFGTLGLIDWIKEKLN